MEIHFSAKKSKVGSSNVVFIPKAIAELLEPERKYNFIIEEKEVENNVP